MTEQCGCGCGSNYHEHHKEGCHCQSCEAKRQYHEHGMDGSCCCAEKFLMLADEAWKEVLKDKIKEKICAQKGEHIEKLAELIATTNGEKWKHKMSAMMKCDQYKDQLKEFFSSCDK